MDLDQVEADDGWGYSCEYTACGDDARPVKDGDARCHRKPQFGSAGILRTAGRHHTGRLSVAMPRTTRTREPVMAAGSGPSRTRGRGRISFRRPVPRDPSALCALTEALREVISSSRFSTLHDLGAALGGIS